MANVMLELGWTRAVLLALGNSSLAFSAVLGLFALGTFVGSIAAVPFADRVRSPQAALGWAMAGTGLIAAVTIPALGVFPLEFAHWLSQKRLPMSYPLFLLLGFTWTSALVFPATVLMGMSVPFACRLTILITRGETADAAGAPARVGRGVGSALAASTAGSLAGAGLVGFVLYRLFGNLWLPLYLATGLVIVAALALMLLDRFAPRRLPLRVAGAAGILTAYAALAVLHRPYGIFDKPESRQRYWNPTTLSLGPLLNYQNAGRAETVADLERNYADAYETLYYRDGENGSVGVFGMKGADPKTLRINGEAEASSGTGSMDMPVQVLAGHLAMLARPGARTALNLGFGSGVSAGCMSLYPDLERLTCLEVSPEVLEGARSFADVNHGALTNPKVVAIAGDGRSHLRHTAALYDVISCQPSNFWIAGQGDLFTREFYRSIASRLTPDGVACQSLIASRMRLQDFRLAVLTFRLVFPGTSLWCVGRHALLLGSMRSIEWSRDWIERCLSEPAIRADLSTLGIDRPEALFRYLRFEHQAILTFAGDGPDNRDFHPRLEYSAPFGLFDGTNELQLLLASAGRLDLQDQAASFAGFEPAARTLIETYRTRGALLQKVDAQLSSWSVSAGMDLLIKIRKEEDAWLWAAAGQLVGRWSMTRSEDQGRLLLLRALLVLDAPALRQAYRALDRGKVDASLLKQAGRGASEGDWTAHLLLAQQALDLDDAQGALDLAKEARRRGAPLRRVAAIQGSAYGLQGDLAAAERSFQEALAAAGKGERGEILYNLGYAREKGKDYLGAIEYQRMAMAEGANPVLSGVALARSLRAAGRPQEAFRAAEEASRKKESAEAFFEAAQALLDQGMHAEAARWMAQAVEADPESYSKDLEALESRGK